jgi:glutamate 5-kinase
LHGQRPERPKKPAADRRHCRGGRFRARLIARKSSAEIEDLLGYVDEPEIIHRDNLILVG